LRLKVARFAIPVIGSLATYIAFNAERVVQVIIDSAAPALVSVIVPFIFCFWWKKANRSGALAGMLGGFITWLIASTQGTEIPPDLISFGVSAVLMIVVTLLTQKIDPPRPLTDIDSNTIELTDRVGSLGFKE